MDWKRIVPGILGFFILIASKQVLAEPKFDQILAKHKIPRESLGLLIVDQDGKNIYSVNEEKMMIPASITKLATTLGSVANQELGTQFKTQILTINEPVKGVLKGPIYFKGGGDPSFVSENLWYLVNIFKRSGIKEIQGDIIVDDSLFDRVRYDESREDVRVSRAYDAPVGALSFNWNSVNVFVRAGKKGSAGVVFIDPENEYFDIDNRVSTVAGAVKEISVEKVAISGSQREKIIVRGKIGERATEHVVYANISNPDIWAGENLKSFLEQRGITVSGKVKAGVTPATAELVAEYASKPYGQILADMNKFSNNFVAEMLTKNLAVSPGKAASLDAGVRRIQDALVKAGLSSSQFKIINPSGLTRENRFSSSGMVKILQALRSEYKWRYDILNSFPISGVDGTLKKRMKDDAVRGRIRAKTGLLNNVASLAGYASAENGREYVFSFMFNGGSDEANVRALFDELLEEAVDSR
ncbi:MAG: D-alanyl-D-alanine carboxypeptidase/D-alanyl-D-alanine-endopeptidase [Bdellovibrionota bacterium]